MKSIRDTRTRECVQYTPGINKPVRYTGTVVRPGVHADSGGKTQASRPAGQGQGAIGTWTLGVRSQETSRVQPAPS